MGSRYIIGVDGGGSKTKADAYDLDGDWLATGISGHSNPVVDFDVAIEHLVNAIKECQKTLGGGDCLYLCTGIAGVETGDYRIRFQQILEQTFQTKVRVMNDAELSLMAVHKGNDGLLTISGTGSITMGSYKGKLEMFGGWGHLLGDEGSGYTIVIDAMKAMINEKESGQPKSLLSDLIFKELNINQLQELKGFVYAVPKGDIASLVPTVLAAQQSGDTAASAILEKAGVDLARLTYRLHRYLDMPDDGVNIALQGGVLTKIPVVREIFLKTLQQKLSAVTVIDHKVEPTIGGFYSAKKEAIF